MVHVRLIIPTEAASETVRALGDAGLFQFDDLNEGQNLFQRSYTAGVRRCDNILRKLATFPADELLGDASFLTGAGGGSGSGAGGMGLEGLLGSGGVTLQGIEARVNEFHKDLEALKSSLDLLNGQMSEQVEWMTVLERAGQLSSEGLHGGEGSLGAEDEGTADAFDVEGANAYGGADAEVAARRHVNLGHVAGLIRTEYLFRLEQLLFRSTRGNVYMRSSEQSDMVVHPTTGALERKSAFMVFFSGQRAKDKVLKICEAMDGRCYSIPEDRAGQSELISELKGRIMDLEKTLLAARTRFQSVLSSAMQNRAEWNAFVLREKAVFDVLNMLGFNMSSKCLVAEGWCPAAVPSPEQLRPSPSSQSLLDPSQFQPDLRLRQALMEATARSGASAPTVVSLCPSSEVPPTMFETSKVTAGVQELVNMYGVARYGEVNPAVSTLVTFPFLFALMYGDAGHGLILMIVMLFFILQEDKLLKRELPEMVEIVFGGRYVLFVMSLFSIYVGFVYNEFFSMPMTIFGKSTYTWRGDEACRAWTGGEGDSGATCASSSNSYAFGSDPIWHGTLSDIQFFNSMKMKLSIIFGVLHMMYGILISLFNALYFKKTLDVLYDFIPQVVFFTSIFGYLALIIVVKWATNWTALGTQPADLFQVLIYMFLSPGKIDVPLIPLQGPIQVLLILVALACIPVMLVAKPYFLYKAHVTRRRQGLPVHGEDGNDAADQGAVDAPFNITDVIVNQLIHTIEFVLGSVSNTASYLRLWALGLAHSQLSTVFWERILVPAFESGSLVAIIVGFYFWLAATTGVLLIMETLSAFLHALRLHWIEWQNKFYRGDGRLFAPFSMSAAASAG